MYLRIPKLTASAAFRRTMSVLESVLGPEPWVWVAIAAAIVVVIFVIARMPLAKF